MTRKEAFWFVRGYGAIPSLRLGMGFALSQREEDTINAFLRDHDHLGREEFDLEISRFAEPSGPRFYVPLITEALKLINTTAFERQTYDGSKPQEDRDHPDASH